jgi:hypothetical protein
LPIQGGIVVDFLPGAVLAGSLCRAVIFRAFSPQAEGKPAGLPYRFSVAPVAGFGPKPPQKSPKNAPVRYGFLPFLQIGGVSVLLCPINMKRLVCWVLIAAALPVGRLAAYEYAEVTLDYVAAKAQQRAQKPFHSPKADLPDFLRQDKLDYDKYREIEFRHENALWATEPLPFRVEFFHPGYLY